MCTFREIACISLPNSLDTRLGRLPDEQDRLTLYLGLLRHCEQSYGKRTKESSSVIGKNN